ncbi:Guanine nucleotide-binding protein G(I)/G(S)/G(O) subunit gamma-12 [Dissostichus eleginoides]|nr:Guanine nucleotide-binding protein G(I)/G(S)/G(O) subunit gamma-12 [Dissostichus eleginoides]
MLQAGHKPCLCPIHPLQPPPFADLFEHGCPKAAMSSKMQSSSSLAQARRMVQQLRMEASFERIKVSKASSDLMRYCGEHAKNDPLLMGIPTSENPFKDKKPCTVL